MYLATLNDKQGLVPAAVDPRRGVARLSDLVADAPAETMAALAQVGREEFLEAVGRAPAEVFQPARDAEFAAPYRRPRKIWGIGLNYVDHAADLTELVPDEPASFLKGDHTIIGPGEAIPLPSQSQRVTAEAELGLVIGKECRDVSTTEALDYVWGFCTILDQTAEDILARNPRFLTRSKNFPGFFSFGPGIVPLPHAMASVGEVADIEVLTVHNGTVHRRNTVGNMRYSPEYLVSFHSRVMPLYPGDIISTGTPGAVQIQPGDTVQCRIPGIGTLSNPVGAPA